jgi:hypothetical protein
MKRVEYIAKRGLHRTGIFSLPLRANCLSPSDIRAQTPALKNRLQ